MFSLKEAISSTSQHPKSLRDNKLKRAGGEFRPNKKTRDLAQVTGQ
jgi:hypothetical protein